METRVKVVALFVTFSVLFVGMFGGTVSALDSVDNLNKMKISEDEKFYNYDFKSESVSQDNVGGPVTILFYDDAYTESTVYDHLKDLNAPGTSDISGGDSYWQASTEYGRIKKYGSWYWDATDGVKYYDCIADDWEDDWEVHIRVYDGGYDSSFGSWCIATTHIEQLGQLDQNAQNFELAEEYIAKAFEDSGYTVYEDYANFYNSLDGNYVSIEDALADGYEGDASNMYNNGLATYIKISS